MQKWSSYLIFVHGMDDNFMEDTFFTKIGLTKLTYYNFNHCISTHIVSITQLFQLRQLRSGKTRLLASMTFYIALNRGAANKSLQLTKHYHIFTLHLSGSLVMGNSWTRIIHLCPSIFLSLLTINFLYGILHANHVVRVSWHLSLGILIIVCVSCVAKKLIYIYFATGIS